MDTNSIYWPNTGKFNQKSSSGNEIISLISFNQKKSQSVNILQNKEKNSVRCRDINRPPFFRAPMDHFNCSEWEPLFINVDFLPIKLF